MVEKLLAGLGDKMNRRGFLGDLGTTATAASSLLLTLCGISRRADAKPTCSPLLNQSLCCCLCKPSTCGPGETPNQWGCAGTWCWQCPYGATVASCRIANCYECYNSSAPSTTFGSCTAGGGSNGCSNIICSRSVLLTNTVCH